MKTLIEAVELWIDSKVESNIRPWLKDMEDIHIRDANRIADLERRVQFYQDSPSPEYNDGEESTVTELSMRLDDMDSRLDDVESSLEDKIDTCDADEMVDIAVNDIDLESQIIDAVKSEIDAIDFKVTVER
jgi:hypothetical protein